ncbi:MAG: TIGR02677 family protein, partial [Deltaproteobacteria bacterium]|nr:TIGR02677 family protein [Deltaproteobacteria bacterium]
MKGLYTGAVRDQAKQPATEAQTEGATIHPLTPLDGAESPRGRESVFSHLAADNAPVYRAILRAFAMARQGFVLHLRPVDISRALEPEAPEISDELLGRALDQLCDWQNLERQTDTSEVMTIEAFYRPRYLYRLTPRGEAAERALALFFELLNQHGELQVAALTDIRAELEEIVQLCQRGEPDDAIVFSSLERIFTRLESLTRRAQSFLDNLQGGFDDTSAFNDADVASFKELVVNYLERFVGELLAIGPRIAQLVEAANGAGIESLLEVAATRELADALDPSAADHRAAQARWRRRWEGLQHWFIGEAGQPSQAELLRAQARKAIIGLLSAVKILHDRRQHRSDRPADLIALAT